MSQVSTGRLEAGKQTAPTSLTTPANSAVNLIPAHSPHENMHVFRPTRVSLPVRYGQRRVEPESCGGPDATGFTRGELVCRRENGVGRFAPGQRDHTQECFGAVCGHQAGVLQCKCQRRPVPTLTTNQGRPYGTRRLAPCYAPYYTRNANGVSGTSAMSQSAVFFVSA
jgi:hypothetical protein